MKDVRVTDRNQKTKKAAGSSKKRTTAKSSGDNLFPEKLALANRLLAGVSVPPKR